MQYPILNSLEMKIQSAINKELDMALTDDEAIRVTRAVGMLVSEQIAEAWYKKVWML